MKAVLFDFDGTLADTLPLLVSCLRGLDKHGRYAHITYEDVRSHSLLYLAYRLITDIGTFSFWRVRRNVQRCMLKHSDEVSLFPGMAELLPRLQKHGLRVGIVTSNRKAFVQRVLSAHGLSVEAIHAAGSLFGKHRKLARALRAMKVDASEALYVGDEVRDIHAARKVGLPVMSVTWGFNNLEALRAEEPDWLIEEPQDIYRALRAGARSTSTGSRRRPRRASGSRSSSGRT